MIWRWRLDSNTWGHASKEDGGSLSVRVYWSFDFSTIADTDIVFVL